MNITKLQNELLKRDSESMKEFNQTVKNMIVNTQIILMRKDREQTQRLREIWIETNLKMADLFEEFKE